MNRLDKNRRSQIIPCRVEGNSIRATVIRGADREESEARYSPAECLGCRAIPMSGNPKARDISTCFAERQNLAMRMQMRRFTRHTNAFSKKIDNLGLCCRAPLHALQFLPRSPDFARHPCDGSGNRGPHLDD
jgi:hypothetical protein